MSQGSLFDGCDGDAPAFGGATFDPALDGRRLFAQLQDVRAAMADHAWRTLRELARLTGHPEASVSARIRDLRKAKFGGYTVERRRRLAPERGIHEYRLL